MQIKKLSEKVTKLYRRDKSKELRKRFWHPKTQKPKIEFFSNKNAAREPLGSPTHLSGSIF